MQIPRCTPNAPSGARTLATLALSAGGLGLGSAVRVRHAAHWASWADSLLMARPRHPAAERMIAEPTQPHFGWQQRASRKLEGDLCGKRCVLVSGTVPEHCGIPNTDFWLLHH